ncbi:hypothetical protein IPM19_04065 [bacterium]|nr:MAG: hypothetical protein IPM19_04065 [bacterium]
MTSNLRNYFAVILLVSSVIIGQFASVPFVFSATLLSDDFTGTTIDTNKWQEIDTGGSGGTTGNIQQNGTLTASQGFAGSVWGTNALTSVDTFDSDTLEVSARITRGSDALLGYGDYNF